MDKLQAMQLFVRVVDSGSFTAAAEQLAISRALASKLVQALEELLGVRLLNRTTRRVNLTEAGQAYYQRASDILAQIGEAETEASQQQLEPRGRLRVTAPVSFATHHLAPALADFQRRFSRVELELNLNDRVVDLIEEGFDMAIRIARLADSSLVARRLAPARMLVVAAPGYVAAHGEPRHPQELATHNCLGYTLAARRDEWTFVQQEQSLSVRVTGSVRVNNGDYIATAAIAGLGIAQLPSFIVGEHLASGKLVRLLNDWQSPELGIYAVYPQGRAVPAKTRSLIDFLSARFGPEPYWDRADR